VVAGRGRPALHRSDSIIGDRSLALYRSR